MAGPAPIVEAVFVLPGGRVSIESSASCLSLSLFVCFACLRLTLPLLCFASLCFALSFGRSVVLRCGYCVMYFSLFLSSCCVSSLPCHYLYFIIAASYPTTSFGTYHRSREHSGSAVSVQNGEGEESNMYTISFIKNVQRGFRMAGHHSVNSVAGKPHRLPTTT